MANAFPSGCYCKWNSSNGSLPPEILAHPGLVGIQLVNFPKNVDKGQDTFDWSKPDARMGEIVTANTVTRPALGLPPLSVVFEWTNSQLNCPPWLLQEIAAEEPENLVALSKPPFPGPVFWSPLYHARRIYQLQQVIGRYVTNTGPWAGMVGALHAGTINWNYCEVAIPHTPADLKEWARVNYTTGKAQAVTRELVDAALLASPLMAVTLSFNQTDPALDGTLTGLAERCLTCALQRWPEGNRVIGQVDFLSCTTAPRSVIASQEPIDPNVLRRIVSVLDHSPQMNFEAIDAATNPNTGMWPVSSLGPAPDPTVILQTCLTAALTHMPTLRRIALQTKDCRTASLVPIIAAANATLQGRVYVPPPPYVPPAPGTVLLSDGFTDAAGTAIDDHTPDVGGPWVTTDGLITITGNKAVAVSLDATTNAAQAVYDAGIADVTIQATIVHASGGNNGVGLVVRWTDSNNFWLLRLLSNQLQIVEKHSGTVSIRATAPFTLVNGAANVLKLVCSGSTLTGTVNGANQVQWTGATSNLTATQHGIRGTNGASRDSWDDVTITAS